MNDYTAEGCRNALELIGERPQDDATKQGAWDDYQNAYHKLAGEFYKPSNVNGSWDKGFQYPGVFEPFTAADWSGKAVPEREWLWTRYVPWKSVAGLYGPPGVAKSLLAQILSTHVALGRPLLGQETRKVPVLYLTCEDSKDELHRRQDAITEAMGVNYGDLGNLNLQSCLDREVSLVNLVNNNLRTTDAYEQLKTVCERIEAGFVVLDVVPDFWSANEIVRQHVNKFVKTYLGGIAQRGNLSILFLAHPSQAGKASGTGESGSTAWEGSVRSRLYLEQDRDEPETRILKLPKSNYAATDKEGVRLTWRDGYLWEVKPDKTAEREVRCKGAFLEILEVLTKQGDHVSTAKTGNYAPRIFVRRQQGIRRTKFREGEYEQAMNTLLNEGRIHQRNATGRKPKRLEIAALRVV